MPMPRWALWRPLFVLAGVLIVVGGPLHPNGTMAEMLADPDWVPSHAFMMIGFLALLVGMLYYRRALPPPRRTKRWIRVAIVGTALQVVEMAFHTAATLDHANLVAGAPTPILTTHIALATFLYPVFALTIIGFILATAHEHTLAAPGIAWLGVLGALAHGAAAPLVILLELDWARVLFPGVILLALWLVLAGLWPLRSSLRVGVSEPVPG